MCAVAVIARRDLEMVMDIRKEIQAVIPSCGMSSRKM